MLHPDFLTELFRLAKQDGLGTLIDSNGTISFEDYPELMEVSDGVMLDIKAFEPEEHKEVTDVTNEMVLKKFHKYFTSGTGDIFPIDMTVHRNPEYVLDIIKGSFKMDLRYLSFYSSDSDVIRVTGYLVKRSELEKLAGGEAVLQDTTALGLGAARNGHILERKVR